MANKKISEGVGKKIVEALKKQSEIEVNPLSSARNQEELEALTEELTDAFQSQSEEQSNVTADIFEEDDFLDNLSSLETTESMGNLKVEEPKKSIATEQAFNLGESSVHRPSQPFVNYQQPPTPMVHDSFMTELDSFEIPDNIAVLKKLISQLPSGVSRHTGAQIIKQTMEALGISMKGVLQEAQQVQESLNNSAKECFSSIQDYKKQILGLEKQAQSHQKQYAALNELISLFVQTGV